MARPGMTNSGEDDSFGAPNDMGVGGDLVWNAQVVEGAFDRGQVPGFVIYDC